MAHRHAGIRRPKSRCFQNRISSQGFDAEGGLDAARGAESMSMNIFCRTDPGTFASEKRLDRGGLGRVIVNGSSAMRMHPIDLAWLQSRNSECRLHRMEAAAALGMWGRHVVSVGRQTPAAQTNVAGVFLQAEERSTFRQIDSVPVAIKRLCRFWTQELEASESLNGEIAQNLDTADETPLDPAAFEPESRERQSLRSRGARGCHERLFSGKIELGRDRLQKMAERLVPERESKFLRSELLVEKVDHLFVPGRNLPGRRRENQSIRRLHGGPAGGVHRLTNRNSTKLNRTGVH